MSTIFLNEQWTKRRIKKKELDLWDNFILLFISMGYMIFDFIADFYFKGVLISWIIFFIFWLLITRGAATGIVWIIIGAFLRPTIIWPRTTMNYFYNIRLTQDFIKYRNKSTKNSQEIITELFKRLIDSNDNYKKSKNHNQMEKGFQNWTLNPDIT